MRDLDLAGRDGLCATNMGRKRKMNKRWFGLLPCVSIAFGLVLSCGSSDGGSGAAGSPGLGGNAGASGHSDGGGNSPGGHSAGVAGEAPGDGGAGGEAPGDGGAGGEAATPGSAGVAGIADGAGAGGDDAGASGAAGAPVDTSPLSPSAIPDLAFWLDGNAQAFSDQDENFPLPPDSGRVRSVPEAPPLNGSWKAASTLERPIRALGALDLRPAESSSGYNLQDTAGTIQTDNSTVAISFRLLNSNSAQGALSARVGMTSLSLEIHFVGDTIGIRNNNTSAALKKHIARGLHGTMIVRFTPTGYKVLYEVEGFRSSETVDAAIDHETASNFDLGYDGNLKSSMFGFVSQVVGINRAVSDEESSRLMTWLTAQPIPDAYPVTKPLVAIVGDSIANGDQIPGWQSWGFTMLDNLRQTYPDVQLLNDAVNGSGIPTVKNSTYSERVLPWYSANRAKNILIVAAGSNDLINGIGSVPDILDRYYGLLQSARATGWKTVACTVLPRSDGLNSGQSAFEAARKAFNDDLVAHAAKYDALADVAKITGLGAVGDSDNTTYYSDKIHPTAPGHALLEPVYRAAVNGLLAP